MIEKIKNRKECRLCGSTSKHLILELESMPFFDEIVSEQDRGLEFSYPMKIFFCNDCKSLQSSHDINADAYYNSYSYSSADSPFIQKYMKSLVRYTIDTLNLSKGDRVLEVGAADGALLKIFKESGAEVLGFEPAKNLCKIANDNNISVIPDLFKSETLNLIPSAFLPIDYCVLLHTFDHLPDPSRFLEDISSVLNPERGVLILEVHALEDIVDNNEAALFHHEHTTFLHIGSMERLLLRYGLRVIDVNFIPKNMCRGGSMLVSATPINGSRPQIKNFKSQVRTDLDELITFEVFSNKLSMAYRKLRNFIDNEKACGRKVAGYGGWGRGVTTLAIAKLTPRDLEFVIDQNINLHGKYTPVSSIQIISPNEAKNIPVDVIIVFNYAYMDEIKESLNWFTSSGGTLVSVLDLLN